MLYILMTESWDEESCVFTEYFVGVFTSEDLARDYVSANPPQYEHDSYKLIVAAANDPADITEIIL